MVSFIHWNFSDQPWMLSLQNKVAIRIHLSKFKTQKMKNIYFLIRWIFRGLLIFILCCTNARHPLHSYSVIHVTKVKLFCVSQHYTLKQFHFRDVRIKKRWNSNKYNFRYHAYFGISHARIMHCARIRVDHGRSRTYTYMLYL